MNFITTVGRPLGLALAALLTLAAAPAARAQAPANDDPCGATVLLPNGALCNAPTTSTNAGATTTPASGYANVGSPHDVWFKFTTAASGPASFGATITVTGNPAGAVQLLAAASCAGPFAVITASVSGQANTTAPRLVTGALQASTTYYLRVYGALSSDTQGAFTICVSDGPATAACLGVSAIRFTLPAGLLPGQALVSFVPGANSLPPYTLYIAGQGSIAAQTYVTNASPVLVSGLIPGGAQTVTITSACTAGGTATATALLSYLVYNAQVCNARPMAVNPTCVPVGGNLFNSSAAGRIGCGGVLSLANYNCQWYKFTTAASGPASTQATVTLTSTAGANELQVWSGNPCPGNNLNALTLLGCQNNSSTSNTTPPVVLTALTPGTTYYVQVGTSRYIPGGGSAGGDFNVCVTSPGGCAAPDLSVGDVGATSAVVSLMPLFNATPAAGYTLTYQAAGGPLQTLTPAAGPPATTLTGLLPGTTYTVTVTANCAGNGTAVPATATFTTLAAAPACPDPAPLAVANLTPVSAEITFAPVSGASGYVVTYQAANSSAQVLVPAPAAPPVALTGLLPNTAYAVRVQAVCAAGPGTAQAVSFVTPPLTAANDECATALPLPIGPACQLTLGTSLNATVSAGVPAPGCAASFGTIRDVWFAVVVPANGIVQVTTALFPGSVVTDTGLALYGGACGNLTLLGCNDNYAGGGQFSQLRLTGQIPGDVLYARVWRFGGNGMGGLFYLCATTDATPPPPVLPCPAVTNVQASALSFTGATLTFSGPANAASYTVTLTPTSGPAITLTATSSPVALTSLAPGTTYAACVVSNCGAAGNGPSSCTSFVTPSPCPAVTGLGVGGLTGTTATVRFVASGPATGGYTLTLTPLAGGTPTVLTAAAPPLVLTGLVPFATYSVSVVGACAGGLTSAPATLTFVNVPYCTANLNTGCGNAEITFVAIPTTPLNNPSGCTTTNGMAYISYPPTGNTTATLVTGTAYQLQATASGTADLTAWIDYNRNGLFEAAEATVLGQGATANTPVTASFTVPAAALPGLTGMRVRSRLAGIGNGPADACTAFTSGETEDYFLALTSPGQTCLPPTAVAATALTATSASVGFAAAAGSAPATAYTASALPTGGTVPVTATGPTAPLTLTGLAPNTAYSLTVTATCAGGASGPSAPPVAFRTLLASRSAALAAALGLFPNPAHAAATLTLPAGLNPTGGTADLLDALGRAVGRWPLAPGSTRLEVPLAGRAAGVYALRLRLGDDTAVKRLVVE